MEIDFKQLNIEEVRDEINLFLWNNNFSTDDMKATNQALQLLKMSKLLLISLLVLGLLSGVNGGLFQILNFHELIINDTTSNVNLTYSSNKIDQLISNINISGGMDQHITREVV